MLARVRRLREARVQQPNEGGLCRAAIVRSTLSNVGAVALPDAGAGDHRLGKRISSPMAGMSRAGYEAGSPKCRTFVAE